MLRMLKKHASKCLTVMTVSKWRYRTPINTLKYKFTKLPEFKSIKHIHLRLKLVGKLPF